MTAALQILHSVYLSVLFIVFCAGSGAVIRRWLGLPVVFLIPVGFGCIALAGLVAFFAWWLSPVAGGIVSLAFGLGCIALFASKATGAGSIIQEDLKAGWPVIAATLLLTASWLCLLQAGGVPAAQRFTWELPIDDQLPRMFADKLAAGESPTPLAGDWLSSDRPPLQTGIVLLFRPFALPFHDPDLAYQTLGTLCQIMWLPALAALGGVLGLAKRKMIAGLFLCSTSGFFLVNSLYVWPKLLAAALFLTAIGVVLHFNAAASPRKLNAALPPALLPGASPEDSTRGLHSPAGAGLAGRRPNLICVTPQQAAGNVAAFKVAPVVGALLALATLAHGGAWFSLLALPAFPSAWTALRRFGIKGMMLLVLAFGAISAPWSAYKASFDPPGNRLVKWHLAGVIDLDERSSLETLRASYSAKGVGEILRDRYHNLVAVAFLPRQLPDESWDEYLRRIQFFNLVPAIGLPLLGIGWLMLGRIRGRSRDPDIEGLIGYSAATVLIWIALMFLPPPMSSVVHAGSYVPVALLIFLGGAVIGGWRAPAMTAVALAHLALFLAAWVLTTPQGSDHTSGLSLPLMVATAVLMLCFLSLLPYCRCAESGGAPNQ